MDKIDFLDGAEAPKGEAVPETVEAPVVETTQEAPVEATPEEKPAQPRAADGKFAKKVDDEPVMVPLKALQEVRDELKQLKAEQPRQQPQQQQVPDVYEDPEGYQNYIAQTVNQATLNATLNLSEELTRQSAGDEIVEAATEWAKTQFQTNPALYNQFISQRNPYGFIVAQYQKEQTFQKLGNDPKQIEAFLAWQAAQQTLQAAPAAQPTPTPTASIASAPSAGGHQQVATGAGVAFSEFIK